MSQYFYSTYNFASFPDLDITPAEEFLPTSLFDVSQGVVGPSGFSIWRNPTYDRATTTILNAASAPRDVPFQVGSIESDTYPILPLNTSQAGSPSSTAFALHDNVTSSPATSSNATHYASNTIPFPVRSEADIPLAESLDASKAGPSRSTASPLHGKTTRSPAASTSNSVNQLPFSSAQPEAHPSLLTVYESQAGSSRSVASPIHDKATGFGASTSNNTNHPEVHPPLFTSFYSSQAGPSRSTASPLHDNTTGPFASTSNSATQPEVHPPLFISFYAAQAGPSRLTASPLHDNATVLRASTSNSANQLPSALVRPEVHPPRFTSFYASHAGPSRKAASPLHDNVTAPRASTSNNANQLPSSPVRTEVHCPPHFTSFYASQAGPSHSTSHAAETTTPPATTTTHTTSRLVFTPPADINSPCDSTPSEVMYNLDSQFPRFATGTVGLENAIASSQSSRVTQAPNQLPAERQTSFIHYLPPKQQQLEGENKRKRKQPADSWTRSSANANNETTNWRKGLAELRESKKKVSYSSKRARRAAIQQAESSSTSRVICPYIDPITGDECLDVDGHPVELGSRRNFERHYNSVHVQYELDAIKKKLLSKEDAVALNAPWARPNEYVCPERTCLYLAEHGVSWSISSFTRIERDVRDHKQFYHPHTLRPRKSQCEGGPCSPDEPAVLSSELGSHASSANAPQLSTWATPGPSKRGGQEGGKDSRKNTVPARYQPY